MSFNEKELDFNSIRLKYMLCPSKDIILNNKVIDIIEKKLENFSHKFTSITYEEDKDTLNINISYSKNELKK